MIPNIECLKLAAERLGIPYSFLDEDRNLLRLELPQPLLFAKTITPFNSEIVAKVCRDKEYAYLLLRGAVAMPKTAGFLDPECREEYRQYVRYRSQAEIAEKIAAEFALPCIVKRNSGAQAQNVFVVHDREEVGRALAQVYDHGSADYDYVALAQEYVPPAREYRAIVFGREVLLAYGKADLAVIDKERLERLRAFISPVYGRLDLRYGGLDIIEDASGGLHLIELNSCPGFTSFFAKHGPEPLVAMYAKILSSNAPL